MTTDTAEMFADKWLSAEPVYLTDMGRCEPAEAASGWAVFKKWRKLEYEAQGLSGVMLLAGPEQAAPEIRYDLGASGWHAVSIGVYTRMEPPIDLLIRMDDEETFSRLSYPAEGRPRAEEIGELFWKIADVTDRKLVLGQTAVRVGEGDGPGAHRCLNASIAYVKLTPLSDGEGRAFQEDRQRTDTRRLFAHNDAHGFHFSYRVTTAEQIRQEIEPFRDSDFSRLYWESGGGDNVYYFSKIASIPTNDSVTAFPRHGDRMHAESWRELRRQGIDPFRVALDYAHEIGLEFHASWRVAGFHAPPMDLENSRSPLYRFRPDLRGVDRYGNQTPRMSFTYPETRRFVISLLREMAGYGVDGICLLYNRRPPVVEYEPPLVEGFRREYGLDPRELDEDDPRWLSYRARTMTQFHREVRSAMDEVAKQMGLAKRIEVSAVVMSSEEENLQNGFDLKAWIEEGLVDTIIPHSSAPNLDSMVETWADTRDAEWFLSLTKGTSCKLALNLMPRHSSAESYRRRAAALYDAGVEHFFFWDCVHSSRITNAPNWSALRRLGHVEEVRSWAVSGAPGLPHATTALKRLGDWDLSYVTPG